MFVIGITVGQAVTEMSPTDSEAYAAERAQAIAESEAWYSGRLGVSFPTASCDVKGQGNECDGGLNTSVAGDLSNGSVYYVTSGASLRPGLGRGS